MNVALDTNRLTDLFQGDLDLMERLQVCEEVWIPFVVLGEMKAGFYGGARHRQNEGLLHRFLAKGNIRILFAGEGTADYYARLFVQLKKAGTPIPHNDLWIAALVLERNLVLISRDQHFDRIPQLMLE